MPPEHVDVNVHPTKKEVHFMYEEQVLQAIHSSLNARLRSANESRTFYTQAVLGTDSAGAGWVPLASQAAGTVSGNSKGDRLNTANKRGSDNFKREVKMRSIQRRHWGWFWKCRRHV